MRIGIDGAFALERAKDSEGSLKAKDTAGGHTGKDKEEGRGRYAEQIVEILATDYPGSEVLVYTPKVARKARLEVIDELHNVEYRVPAPSGFQGRMWRLFGITNCLQPDKIDVYHGLNGELPLNIAAAHVPTVVSVGAEEMATLKGRGRWPMKQVRQYVAIESLRNATRVIADSEEIKSVLTSSFGIACDRIDVIPPAELSGTALMSTYELAISVNLH